MASTNFTDYQTVITANYLNDNDELIYGPINLTQAGYVTKLWSYKMPSDGSFSSPIGPVNLNGTSCILFTGLDNYVYAIRVSDGTLFWRTATGDDAYGRCQAGDVNSDGQNEVFAASHDGKIWSLTSTGTMRWQFDNLYDREATGTTTAATSTSITDSGKTWAANAFIRAAGLGYGATLTMTSGPANGQSKEITVNPGGSTLTVASAFSPAPTSGGGDTYVITPKYPSDKYFQHAGTLVNESGTWYLYVGGFDNHIYKLNANTGALVWKYATLENIEPYPLVTTISSTRYVFSCSVDGYVRCLNAATGVVAWSTNVGACDCFLNIVDVDNDGTLELLVSTRAGRVQILNATDGTIKYTSTITGALDYPEINAAAVPVKLSSESTTRIFTGGDSGTVWCFDSSGNTLWQRVLLPNVLNSSIIAHDLKGDGNLKVLQADSRGVVHCMDAATGTYYGAFYTKGVIEGLPLYGDINNDGFAEIVVVTQDGYLECFKFNYGAVHAADGIPGNTQWAGSQT